MKKHIKRLLIMILSISICIGDNAFCSYATEYVAGAESTNAIVPRAEEPTGENAIVSEEDKFIEEIELPEVSEISDDFETAETEEIETEETMEFEAPSDAEETMEFGVPSEAGELLGTGEEEHVVGKSYWAQDQVDAESNILLYYKLLSDSDVEIRGAKKVDNNKICGKIVIPEYIEGYKVVSIGKSAFNDERYGGELVLPNTLEKIDDYAFTLASIEGEVNIPDSVTYVGLYAFSNCYKMEKIHFPKGTKVVPDGMCSGCNALKTVELHDDVTSIGESAFYGCKSWSQGFVFPSNLTTIKKEAFRDCTKLNFIKMNIKINKIGDYAFNNTGIGGIVNCPQSLTSLGTNVFDSCKKLEEVSIGCQLTTIPFGTFSSCSGLKMVLLPQTVTSIGSSAFWNCKKLASINFPTGLKSIGEGAFINNESLKGEFELPNSVTTINDRAFYGCTGYTGDLKLPTSLTTLGANAFRGCTGLDGTIYIPSTITNQGNTSFIGCTNAERIVNDSGQAFMLPDDEYWYKLDGTKVSKVLEAHTTVVSEDYFEFDYITYQKSEQSYNYKFDPNWFKNTGNKTYNQDIAKISIRLTMATTKEDGSNIVEFMEKLGFDPDTIRQDYPNPASGNGDTIGTTMGNLKMADGTTLVLVAVRSGRYTKEWRGNFKVKSQENLEIDHAGFKIAAEQVNARLNNYLNANVGSGPVKIWYVGYSRGAAVSNMAAAKAVDGEIGNSKVTGSNVYAYCFECPKNTRTGNAQASQYGCIWNIINPVDFVPQVAMGNGGTWNYKRYGTTYVLPSKMSNANFDSYNSVVTGNFLDILKAYKVTWDTYSPEMTAAKVCNFMNGDETIIYEMLRALTTLVNSPEKYYSGHPSEKVKNVLKVYYPLLGWFGPLDTAKTWQENFQDIFEKVMGGDDPLYIGDDDQYKKGFFIQRGHYFELCLAWMDAFQSSTGGSLSLDVLRSHKSFGRITVNCPIDVEVYDEDNNLVGQINDNTPTEIDGGIYTTFDENGQKVIYVPGDSPYHFVFKATDKGEVNVNYESLDAEDYSMTSLVSFRDIEVEEGDALTLDVAPSKDDEKEAEIELTGASEEKIEPTLVQNNEEIQYYEVNVDVEGNGTAQGAGSYVSGEFVMLKAVPDEFNVFKGWKMGNEIVSNETEYRIPVNGNVNVTAVFGCEFEGFWISGIEDSYEYTGSAIKPEVKVYEDDVLLVPGKDYTVTYSNNTNIYTLAEGDKGFLAAKAPTIKVTGKGNYSGTDSVTFKIAKADFAGDKFTTEDIVVVANGKEQKPAPVFKWNGKAVPAKSYKVCYFLTNDDGEATGEPLLSVKEPGNYIIRITAGETGNFCGSKDEKLTLIADRTMVSKLTVGAIAPQAYTGSALEPVLTVKNGKTVLEKGIDYTVEYRNNTAVGTATVVITGINGFAGTKTTTFKITGTALSKATIEGIASPVIYTGNEVTFEDLKLYIKGTKTASQIDLAEGEDYTVSYSNNLKAGTATVSFTGINGYIGTVKKTFKITAFKLANEPERIDVVLLKDNEEGSASGSEEDSRGGASGSEEGSALDSVEYSKGGAKPAVRVTFKNADGTVRILEEKTDYTVAYSNNTAVNDGSNAKKLPTVKVTLKGNCSGTVSRNFAITPKDISKTEMSAPDKVYSPKGGAYKSAITIKDTDGKPLTAKKDYDAAIEYSVVRNGEKVILDAKSVVDAGEIVTVTVNATEGGNYSGTKSCSYRVTAAAISTAKISVDNQTFTGRAIVLTSNDIVAKKGNETLEYGTDYIIVPGSYSNNINKGNATVLIQGIGNYGGTVKVKFTIKAKGVKWWWNS